VNYGVRHSQEDEGEDDPGSQKDSDGAVKLPRMIGVGIGNTETGVKECGVGKPEATIKAKT